MLLKLLCKRPVPIISNPNVARPWEAAVGGLERRKTVGLFSDLFAPTVGHADGSSTEYFSTGSVTRDPDGNIREYTMRETMLTGATAVVTRDGNDKIINAQWVSKK